LKENAIADGIYIQDAINSNDFVRFKNEIEFYKKKKQKIYTTKLIKLFS